MGKHAVEPLPLSDQRTLAVLAGHRQETIEAGQQRFHVIQATDEQQGPGVEDEQARSAAQQLLGQRFAQLQHTLDIATVQELLFGQALQQAGRNIRLLGVQRMLESRVDLTALGEPLAGAPMQGRRRPA